MLISFFISEETVPKNYYIFLVFLCIVLLYPKNIESEEKWCRCNVKRETSKVFIVLFTSLSSRPTCLSSVWQEWVEGSSFILSVYKYFKVSSVPIWAYYSLIPAGFHEVTPEILVTFKFNDGIFIIGHYLFLVSFYMFTGDGTFWLFDPIKYITGKFFKPNHLVWNLT